MDSAAVGLLRVEVANAVVDVGMVLQLHADAHQNGL